MLAHPILINRPVVVTPLGTKLCRPSEVVLDILPDPQQGAFTKEDGEAVIDEREPRQPLIFYQAAGITVWKKPASAGFFICCAG
jgi:hypothetical protein